MQEYLPILQNTKLFSGVKTADLVAILDCLQASKQNYSKDSYIFREGEQLRHITILVRGCVHIQRDDYWGNRSIINVITPGEMFGEAYIGPESGTILNDVIAVEDSTVMFFDFEKLLTTCSTACRFHKQVIQNLFYAVSEKNRRLVQKLGHMSKRTTREKLISYLSEEAKKQNSGSITIPFNRQQLADFLSVDRSAMSNELCKMRDDGMITFEKNKFRLL